MLSIYHHSVPPTQFRAEVVHHCDRVTGKQSEWLRLTIDGNSHCVFPPGQMSVREYLGAMQKCIDDEDAYQFDNDMKARGRIDEFGTEPDISNGQQIKPDNNFEPKTEDLSPEVPF